MNPNEAQTRRDKIDPALERAGWSLDPVKEQVRFEIPVDGYDAEPWNGVTDYCLYLPNHEVIAIVEAKRQSRDPRVAEQQVRHYVTEIAKHQSFQPFAFMANGIETYFWDVGNEQKRPVAGFFSQLDLENLLYLKQNRRSLIEVPIQTHIAGRVYQQEAIRRIGERFDAGYRRALLVMATGTGKTRTTMALIDLFMRANQARRVLFVADRDPLVEQALDDGFKAYLPDEPCDRIRSYNINTSSRLYVSALKTLEMNCRKFTPSFFDLIIFDEAHRSIYNYFREAIEYFDARIIGLTAAPAGFIDRNTFITFHCSDSGPTYLYPYQTAVAEGFLVDYDVYQAQTHFQRGGIRGATLSEEERNTLIEQGIDPDELNYEGTELERTVSNRDTLRRQWEEIMEVCYKDQSGQLPGKTIMFALTKKHALRLAATFEEMYPQFPNLVQVITSGMERSRDLIKNFKRNDMPRIAISVDLMDTGVDVPEVVNLVFMKPVQSQIKLEQMIGRGTRSQEACRYLDRLPEGKKEKFLIIDFWENQFNKAAEEVVAQELPVLVKIFNTRLKLLEQYLSGTLADRPDEDYQQVIADVRSQITQIPTSAFTVQKVYSQIEPDWTEGFWLHLTSSKLEFLRAKVAPLMRLVGGTDVPAATFINKVERLKLEILTDSVKPATLESIAENVSRLPDFVLQDSQNRESVKICTSGRLQRATPAELNQVIANLAQQMRNRREKPNAFLEIDLKDAIAISGLITLGEGGEQVYVQEYRERVERKVLELVESHPTIAAIRNGEAVNDLQLVALERTLRQELGGSNLQLTESNIRKAFNLQVGSLLGFLRSLLELEALSDYETVVQRNFEQYIAERQYNADQIQFLRAVQNVFLQKRRIEMADLYDEPLDRFGEDAVERWFTEQDVQELLALTERLAA
ncbi:MAG TPA: DEAD/DEAH box helicase family protein [Coleofasciculaceae cyanobacterium]|jgi:type I restriction enzyme R subunit